VNGLVQALHNNFKSRHPRKRQVTVLEENPATFGFSIINHSFSLLALALTKRDHLSLTPHALFFGEGLEVLNGVGTSTEDENER
jgi:hypothetical protein